MPYSSGDTALNLITNLKPEFEQLQILVGALRRRIEQLEENNGNRSESSPAVSQ